MRQFDTLPTYFDNDGVPLVGRARFCDTDGNLQEVTDRDGTVIDSVVFTDASGRLSSQVFLKDVDYVVYFDRYDGGANPYTDDDESSWNNQFTVKNLYDTFNISVDTEGEQCVSGVDALRATDPATIKTIEGVKYVKLLGYSEPGDVDAVSYYWDDSSTDNDDGGSVLKADSMTKGRWKIVECLSEVDVRHFGAFPMIVAEIDMEQEGAIQNAVNYANSKGLKLFFPVVGNNVYYDISGKTFSGVKASSKARFFCKSGSTANITDVEDFYLYADTSNLDGTINVRAETLRTSYNTGNYANVNLLPTARIIMDSSYTAHSVWKDLEVVLEVDQTNPDAFRRCTFSGDGVFVNNVNRKFYNCEIRETLFEDGYDYELTEFSDCESSVYKWSSADNYLTYFCKKNKSADIDLNGETVSSLDLDWDCKISNGTISTLYIGNGEDETREYTVSMENVVFTLKATSYAKTLVLENVTASTSDDNYGLICDNFISRGSAFSCAVLANVVSISSSSFSNNVSPLEFTSGSITGSTFGGSNRVSIDPSEDVVSGVCVNGCIFTGSKSGLYIYESAITASSVTVKNSVFINNVLQGTKRDLVTKPSLCTLTYDTCYFRNNVNANTEKETSDADMNEFTCINVTGAGVVNNLGFNLSSDYFSTDAPGDTRPSDSAEYKDGSIYVQYSTAMDARGKVLPKKPYYLYVRILGTWMQLASNT